MKTNTEEWVAIANKSNPQRFFVSLQGEFFAILQDNKPNLLTAYSKEIGKVTSEFMLLEKDFLLASIEDPIGSNSNQQTLMEVESIPNMWIRILNEKGIQVVN